MSRTRRFVTVALCAAVTACVIVPSFISAGEAPSTAPAAAPAKADGRSMKDIDADLHTASGQFRDAVPSLKMVGDAAFRKDNVDKVLPPLKKMSALLGEVATVNPDAADQATMAQISTLGMAVAFGDKESAKALSDFAAGKDKNKAIAAKCALALGNWVSASGDVKAQEKVLADYIEMAKADPKENQFAGTLKVMSQLGAANADMSKKALAVISDTLTGEAAQQMSSQIAAVDKPIVLAGRTTTGGKFSSASMKGKVILVDFWATWCGPCKASLPEVKKLYADYHAKGLEIIGVDCDGADAVVNDFIKDNDMGWVQLRETSQSDDDNWNPLAKKYGVDGIPTMFIIDKKGVLRYVDGREDPEEKVKKLLAEPDAATAKPAPANLPTAPAK